MSEKEAVLTKNKAQITTNKYFLLPVIAIIIAVVLTLILPSRACIVDEHEYANGETIKNIGYQCFSRDEGSTKFRIKYKVCDNGQIKTTKRDGECANTWNCCQVGDTVKCVSSWDQCQCEPDCEVTESKSCLITGNKYIHGEIIEKLGYSCIGGSAAKSPLQSSQTICRNGKKDVVTRNISCGDDAFCCQVKNTAYCATSERDCHISALHIQNKRTQW
eukprot:168252_1